MSEVGSVAGTSCASLFWFQKTPVRASYCSWFTCIAWLFTLCKSSKLRNKNSLFIVIWLRKWWTLEPFALTILTEFNLNINVKSWSNFFLLVVVVEKGKAEISDWLPVLAALSSLTGWWECPLVSHTACWLLGAKYEVGLTWCNLHSSQQAIAY